MQSHMEIGMVMEEVVVVDVTVVEEVVDVVVAEVEIEEGHIHSHQLIEVVIHQSPAVEVEAENVMVEAETEVVVVEEENMDPEWKCNVMHVKVMDISLEIVPAKIEIMTKVAHRRNPIVV